MLFLVGPLATGIKPGRHQVVDILTDPTVARIDRLAFGISVVFLAVTALL